MDIKRELGIEPTSDKREIRRAYARRLKETHPEDDPEGFQRLREAYEAALEYAEYIPEAEIEEPQPLEVAETPEAESEPAPPRRARPVSRPARQEIEEDPEQRRREEARRAVNAMVGKIAERLDEDDEDAAVVELEAALANPLLFNLKNRRNFELRVLEEIGGREPLPWATAKAAVHAFRWDEHWTDLPYDHQDLADRLLSVPLAEERLARLRDDARRRFTRDYRKSAARVLLGPYRPLMFKVFAGADMVQAMGELLEELRIAYPAILEREVDPRVLAWWNNETTDPQERLNKRSRRVTWSIIGVSFLIGLARAIFDHS